MVNEEFARAQRYNLAAFTNADLIIIRALTRESVKNEYEDQPRSATKLMDSFNSELDESLTSYEREILDDCQPISEDELFSKVRMEEAKKLFGKQNLYLSLD